MEETEALWTELRNAVFKHHYETAAGLLAAHPELLTATNSDGETVLHFLAVENDTEGVSWLHERGCELNTRNASGTPVLFEVAQLGLKEFYAWFVEHGADSGALSTDGQDIVTHLKKYKCDEMAAFVEQYGA
ncbi:ankyrin repeat domain-containing protein [Geobacter sp. FeAm09]|uniref:ankyrin repeat domain-containing protein n=1 Tax=Geobacter sp. FeAm09 TaxID=2597769 RepID=UPI0011EDF2D9|nr:ankyrin repeat domain-containing protein [Geobacter sp. FeAm09]QEM67828.1 ankyrin repeat domain-containing protein [Geobacter sp. FeAm09]